MNDVPDNEPLIIDEAEDEAGSSPIYRISTYGADYTVDTLVKRLRQEVFFVPDFQRSYVWTLRQAATSLGIL